MKMKSAKFQDDSHVFAYDNVADNEGSKLLSLKIRHPEDEEEVEESKAKVTLRNIADGKVVTVIMSLVTIYALIGDDIRLWATDKTVDTGFYSGLMI